MLPNPTQVTFSSAPLRKRVHSTCRLVIEHAVSSPQVGYSGFLAVFEGSELRYRIDAENYQVVRAIVVSKGLTDASFAQFSVRPLLKR